MIPYTGNKKGNLGIKETLNQHKDSQNTNIPPIMSKNSHFYKNRWASVAKVIHVNPVPVEAVYQIRHKIDYFTL